MELKINPEYHALLPKLSPEQYEGLKRSLIVDGQHYPIAVNSEGVILDGHNRFKINRELGHKNDYIVVDFDDPLDEKLFVIDSNLLRRQLGPIQRTRLLMKREEIWAEKAQKTHEATLPKKGEKGFQPVLASRDVSIKASNMAVRGSDISPRTYERSKRIIEEAEKDPVLEELVVWVESGDKGVRPVYDMVKSETSRERIKKILESDDEDLKEKVKTGKTSVTYAYNKLMRVEKHRNPIKLPEGQFDVIYADPPWQYDIPTRGAPDMHYQTMSVEEICDLKGDLPVAEDCILFLWATNPKLQEALQVMKAWGFKYKTNATWVKDKIGTGYYFRGKHELLLVGTRGSIPVPEERNRPPSVIEAPRGVHSSKPMKVYDMLEAMYPNRQYLEMFGRSERAGWSVWGFEA